MKTTEYTMRPMDAIAGVRAELEEQPLKSEHPQKGLLGGAQSLYTTTRQALGKAMEAIHPQFIEPYFYEKEIAQFSQMLDQLEALLSEPNPSLDRMREIMGSEPLVQEFLIQVGIAYDGNTHRLHMTEFTPAHAQALRYCLIQYLFKKVKKSDITFSCGGFDITRNFWQLKEWEKTTGAVPPNYRANLEAQARNVSILNARFELITQLVHALPQPTFPEGPAYPEMQRALALFRTNERHKTTKVKNEPKKAGILRAAPATRKPVATIEQQRIRLSPALREARPKVTPFALPQTMRTTQAKVVAAVGVCAALLAAATLSASQPSTYTCTIQHDPKGFISLCTDSGNNNVGAQLVDFEASDCQWIGNQPINCTATLDVGGQQGKLMFVIPKQNSSTPKAPVIFQ